MSERTKLVVRHLPPALPEQVFWNTLGPWLDPIPSLEGDPQPPKCVATFKAYVPGKVRQNKNKVDVPSRAYIQFATADQVIEFHQGYANQAFRDSKGNVTFPKVEFAPYQKAVSQPKKIDARIGTIEADSEYQSFMQRLNAPPAEEPPTPNGVAGDSEKVQVPKITPLIEHLRNVRKAAQEAAIAAQQQRHAPAPKTSTTHSSGRPFSGQPQIMKRVVANALPASSPAPSTDASTIHDHPPHMQGPSQSSSKPSKHNKGAPSNKPFGSSPQTTSSPAKQPLASSSNKPVNTPQSSKPHKSKRPPRGTEDQLPQPAAPDGRPKDPSSKPAKAPKTIIHASKKPVSTAPESQNASATASTSNYQNHAQPGAPKEKADPERGGPFSSTRGKAPSSGRGGVAGGRKSGRGGGKGGKSNATSHGPSQQASPAAPPTILQKAHRPQSSPSKVPAPQSQKAKADEPPSGSRTDQSGEAASARRRLGMALAGIVAKTEKRKNDHPDDSAPPSSGS